MFDRTDLVLTKRWTHTRASVQAVVCAVVNLTALPWKVRPAVAPPVSFLIGQTAPSIFTGRSTQFTFTTEKTTTLKVTWCSIFKEEQYYSFNWLQLSCEWICFSPKPLRQTVTSQRLVKAVLPEMLTSLQVPLTRTLPSGHVHVAPVGFSKHMKSQDILRHGFDAVNED